MNKHDRSGERVNRRTNPLAIALMTTLLPAPVLAQINELPAADAEAPTVVVTATRYPVDAATVGSSITVITEQELQQQQTRFVSDILREVPGVSFTRFGTIGTQGEIRIRGAKGNQTLVIIDGVRQTNPGSGFGYDPADLLARDIERIEVLRGPQATLYGSNTIGGVINIITKRGKGGVTATSEAQGGSYNTFYGGSSISGATDIVNGYVGLSGFRTDGANISRTGGEHDGYENLTLNTNAGIKPLENLEFSLNLNYVDVPEFQYDGTNGIDSNGFRIPSDANNHYDRSTLSGRAQAKLTLLDGMFESIAGYSGFHSKAKVYDNGDPFYRFNGDTHTVDYQGNLFLDTPKIADASHTLAFIYERQQQTGDVYSAFFDKEFDSIINNGYAGEYRLSLWGRLFLTGGARYDVNNKFENFLSPRFTAALLFPETDSKLHGSWGKGVQNPSLPQLFGVSDTFRGNPNLEPENSVGWDAGIEQSFFDNRVTAGATYFNNQVRDFISSATIPGTTLSTVVNLPGQTNIQGVETSIKTRLYEGLSLNGTYTYTDGEDANSRTLVRLPRNTASAVLNYAFLKDAEGHPLANININASYTGEQIFTASRVRPVRRSERVTLDDFWLVNLALSYEFLPGLEVIGGIENLLDEQYEATYGYRAAGIAGYGGLRGRITF
jgi:vitamin B12 transporter